MARNRYRPTSRRSGRPSQNVMGEMFQKTPWWVWIIVLLLLILFWKLTGR
jgi:hypothetical protein